MVVENVTLYACNTLNPEKQSQRNTNTSNIVTRKGLRIPTNPVRDAKPDNLSFPGNGANLMEEQDMGWSMLGSNKFIISTPDVA